MKRFIISNRMCRVWRKAVLYIFIEWNIYKCNVEPLPILNPIDLF